MKRIIVLLCALLFAGYSLAEDVWSKENIKKRGDEFAYKANMEFIDKKIDEAHNELVKCLGLFANALAFHQGTDKEIAEEVIRMCDYQYYDLYSKATYKLDLIGSGKYYTYPFDRHSNNSQNVYTSLGKKMNNDIETVEEVIKEKRNNKTL